MRKMILSWWFVVSMGGTNAPIKDIGPFATSVDCYAAMARLVHRYNDDISGINPRIPLAQTKLVLGCHERVSE